MIEIQQDDWQAISADADSPQVIVDPKTQEEYVLIRAEVYARMRAILNSMTKRANWDDQALDAYEAYRKSP